MALVRKLALVDFFNELTVHICEVKNINKSDSSNLIIDEILNWNKAEELFVYWRAKSTEDRQKFPCRIIQFSGK